MLKCIFSLLSLLFPKVINIRQMESTQKKTSLCPNLPFFFLYFYIFREYKKQLN